MASMHYKRDCEITADRVASNGHDSYRYCCVGHDGTRKSHKKDAARRFRRGNRVDVVTVDLDC